MPLDISFKRDTKKRKHYFTPESFAHPAKMDLGLLSWIVAKYTKPSEVILDPMAGMGTTMLACTLGRDVVLVELEEKFCQMCQDNWEIVQTKPHRNYQMGSCQIIQGDARQLDGLLSVIKEGDKITRKDGKWRKGRFATVIAIDEGGEMTARFGSMGKYFFAYTKNYTKINKTKGRGKTYHSNADGQIGELPYGQIDKIITSPPYEEAMGDKHFSPKADSLRAEKSLSGELYSNERQQDRQNIGNLKSDSYLEAMLQVYQQCYAVLKPGGLMILVTKDFIRKQKRIYLSLDTIALCQQAGFELVDWHFRRLLHQSFWRVIYYKKYPEVERIDHEDILVFQK